MSIGGIWLQNLSLTTLLLFYIFYMLSGGKRITIHLKEEEEEEFQMQELLPDNFYQVSTLAHSASYLTKRFHIDGSLMQCAAWTTERCKHFFKCRNYRSKIQSSDNHWKGCWQRWLRASCRSSSILETSNKGKLKELTLWSLVVRIWSYDQCRGTWGELHELFDHMSCFQLQWYCSTLPF